MAARTYPYERWPRFGREDARLLRAALHALAWPRGPVLHEAAALLGAPVRLQPAAAELWDTHAAQAALPSPLLALSLEQVAGTRMLPLLCELPPELGALLVDRVLGGDGRSAHPVGEGLDDLSAGVLGYLAARLAALAGAGLRVRDVLSDVARARTLLGDERVLVWSLSLELADERVGCLRVFLPEANMRELAGHDQRKLALPAVLRELPLTLCAHAASVVLSGAQLSALALGDVVVPEHCRLAPGADGWQGEVELHVMGSQRARFLCKARGSALAIETLKLTGEPVMTEAKRIETEALDTGGAALAGDAPIALCLELARFTLTLEELSRLRPGELLSTGRAIGESVTLCAAGRAIARGELVDIDGDVGLRVLELL
jgi:type III secretion protein Q